MDEFADLDATALGELVRRGDVKPVELVDEAIARTERLNPTLNAVIHDLSDSAATNALARAARFLKSRRGVM